MISLSEQKDIALEVKVSNLNGDDAHEASVVALFPRALSYSAYSVADGVSLSFPVTVALTHAHEHTFQCGSDWNLLFVPKGAGNLQSQ